MLMIHLVSVAYSILLLMFNLITSSISNLHYLHKDRVTVCTKAHAQMCSLPVTFETVTDFRRPPLCYQEY
jgi:hypothetical protein